MTNDCPLCLAVKAAGSTDGPYLVENSILQESESFVLLPCVGPLVPGQAIVVSRKHYPSLAAMGTEAIEEYELFVRNLKHSEIAWLEAEHGSSSDDNAGACVTHAHVHLIPGMGSFDVVFDGVLPELYAGDHLSLPSGGEPYVFLRGGGPTRVYSGAGLPSQMLRQTICSALGRSDWDWRSTPRDHLLDETLRFWRGRG